ncbi:MAG: hypothetical protein OXH57_10730 [Ekhidna sp.]|nr:hypothetical protein [Ekhidna sp.]
MNNIDTISAFGMIILSVLIQDIIPIVSLIGGVLGSILLLLRIIKTLRDWRK